MLYFRPVGISLNNNEVLLVIWSELFMQCIKVSTHKFSTAFIRQFVPSIYWNGSKSLKPNEVSKILHDKCYEAGAIEQDQIDWLNKIALGFKKNPKLTYKQKHAITEMNFLLKRYCLPSGEWTYDAIITDDCLQFSRKDFDLKINPTSIPLNFINKNKSLFGYLDAEN